MIRRSLRGSQKISRHFSEMAGVDLPQESNHEGAASNLASEPSLGISLALGNPLGISSSVILDTVMPWLSPFFAAIQTGNIVQVQHMLSTGEASIWDEENLGQDAVHHAARTCTTHAGVTLLEFFIYSGVDIIAVNRFGWPSRIYLDTGLLDEKATSQEGEEERKRQGAHMLRVCRLFNNHQNWIIPRPTTETGRMSPRPQSDTFRLWSNPSREHARLIQNET